jgi:hypothetical protein
MSISVMAGTLGLTVTGRVTSQVTEPVIAEK